MAEFLTATEINLALENLIKEAKRNIILISPYIKLHDRLKDQLKRKKDLHDFEITLVFGKNEEDISKSMGAADLDFFIGFPNIEILYEKNLHAKYYANEYRGLITSMNLHQFSQNTNIEVGVMFPHKDAIDSFATNLVGKFTGGEDVGDAMWKYFNGIIENGEMIFSNIPDYESGFLGIGKKYMGSKVEVNRISEFFGNARGDYNTVYTSGNSVSLVSSNKNYSTGKAGKGVCIRCASEIPYNPHIPYCAKCFSIWQQFENPFYEEKFCHGCSKPETSTMDRPLCQSCFKANPHM